MTSARFFNGDNRPPIWRDSEAGDGALPSEASTVFSGFQVPHAQHMVDRGGDCTTPVGRDRYGSDGACMALERAQRLAALQAPDPQRPVSRGRDRSLPVGGYGHGSYPVRMALEHTKRLPVL